MYSNTSFLRFHYFFMLRLLQVCDIFLMYLLCISHIFVIYLSVKFHPYAHGLGMLLPKVNFCLKFNVFHFSKHHIYAIINPISRQLLVR